MKVKFLKCMECGKIVEVLEDSSVDTICCKTPMLEIIANTVDAAIEKHIPVFEQNGNNVKVSVGSILHPMEENHYIKWIYVVTNKNNYCFSLKPGDIPVINFILNDNENIIDIYAYCNLHSLWKK